MGPRGKRGGGRGNRGGRGARGGHGARGNRGGHGSRGNRGGRGGGRGKSNKFNAKPRKTYSLYPNSSNNEQNQGKRKHEHNTNTDDHKRKKVEEFKPKIKELTSSESEEEVEDHMNQLRSTFGGNSKRSLAIDSSDDSDTTNDVEDNDSAPLSDGSSSESDVDLGVMEGEVSDNDEGIEQEMYDSDSGSIDEDKLYIDDSVDDEDFVTSDDDDQSHMKDGEKNTKTDIGKNSDPVKIGEQESKSDDEEIELDLEPDDDQNLEDPFVIHIFYDLNESLLSSVQNVPPLVTNHQENWPLLGNLLIQISQFEETKPSESNQFTISEEKIFASAGKPPQKVNMSKSNLSDLNIKTQIMNQVSKANKPFQESNLDKEAAVPFTHLQNELFSILNNYQDLYYPQRTFENAEEIRFVYCLHAVNHILKTRSKVLHHNARLSKKDDVPEEFRDQGLVRPKILIIAPFRSAAYKIIRMLIDLLIPEDKGNVINKNRFMDEFSTGGELIMPKKNPKPEDYELLFAGNSNDDFKIGMTVTKKSVKLYADFYSSDIIIASPLGLRYIIGAEGDANRDHDFLASIELLILDQTEVFLMQNWDHLLHIMQHLHLQPKESHGTDFSRVRTWSLNGWAKYYRQTLIFSSIMLPEINSIFNKKCYNYAGKIKVINPVQLGSIRQVYVPLPHVFHKFEAHNVAQCMDSRFEFFVSKILPQQKDSLMKQTLIYVANYFDYVRLRNYFKKEDVGFVQICEYSKDAKVARARDMFFHGDAHFLLYTERYHFFNRKIIKGIRHILFYQPPNFPNFYYEMCNLMQEANMNKKVGNTSNMTVTVLCSKYDVQQLSAIVGTDRAGKIITSDRNVHMLLTEGD